MVMLVVVVIVEGRSWWKSQPLEGLVIPVFMSRAFYIVLLVRYR